MGAILNGLGPLWGEALRIWRSGGWAMIPIAVISVILFGLGMHVLLALRSKRFRSVPEATWRRWLDRPEECRGPVGRLIADVADLKTLDQAAPAFSALQSSETAPFERDLSVMKICVSAAPLVGLLGTVTGMLTTFGALSTGSGGDQTMNSIAAGISEALVTTETGLVIALPGLFFQYQLARQLERYKAFLAHLETVCTQSIYKRMRGAAA